ncbi:MAG: transcription-repair coupling factor [Chlamydiota bacterium]
MLTEDFLSSNKLRFFQDNLAHHQVILAEELWDAPKALMACLLQKITGKHVLIVTGRAQEESRLFDDLSFFSPQAVADFPAWETLPSEKIAPSPDVVGQRYKVLHQLTTNEAPTLITCSLQALLQKLIHPDDFSLLCYDLTVGQDTNFSAFIEDLTLMGYRRCPVAADKGEFAVRGGILDIFPVSSADPYRIDFWGNTVESIRIYDPVGQKSVGKTDKIFITPAQELELLSEQEQLATILDYLGQDTIIIFDELAKIEDRYVSIESIPGTVSKTFGSFQDFLELVNDYQTVLWSNTEVEKLSPVQVADAGRQNLYSQALDAYGITFEIFGKTFRAERWLHPFTSIESFYADHLPAEGYGSEDLLQAISLSAPNEYNYHLLTATSAQEKHFRQQLAEHGFNIAENTLFHHGYLSSGFALPDARQIIIPYTEISHHYKVRRPKLRSTYHTPPAEMYEFNPGELVVHLNNGIGKYLGIEKRPDASGIEQEFMLIEYSGKSKLYVPLTQSHLISKYVGHHEELPKLSTLGSKNWQRLKTRTEQSIIGYASDLLDLYAQRSIKGGFPYPEDTEEMLAFEEDFPYVETEDQLRAITDVKKDMIASEAMDRLTCGDVGYGKTEIAMRAAFKAVVEGGKQVAILVPTTVLAIQHYETLKERMYNFPVNIEVLARSRNSKQTRQILEKVSNGAADIVIGTHRLISDDVNFHNLGLVIIDEEQRFGVKAKEKLRASKVGVDCLTLSATPIPRTLYMSLIGARDMSVINTPPQDRLPIKNIVQKDNDEVFRNAILRELSRDGQVYIIHNRVETIYDLGARIRKLLPQARIAVVHGQMSPEEIDQTFHNFKSAKVDILLATTIIENGIDIPNANTIIIDRAEHFGLATLYQLRGRVGRWNRQAYAYFVTPQNRPLSEVARQRLAAIVEAGNYGGGMKIAMRDLEIRGSGDILGTEQSGHISAIGFHLYCKLLKRAITALQGKAPQFVTDTKVDFPYDARIPEEYIDETSLRMEIYQRWGEAENWETTDELLDELKDRFGPPPLPIEWLYRLTRLRIFGSLNSFTELKIEKHSFSTTFRNKQGRVTKRLLINPISNPHDLERQIIDALKANFIIKATP